jgi:hypothetical protein
MFNKSAVLSVLAEITKQLKRGALVSRAGLEPAR